MTRELTDLAARRLGGMVLAASDEWFGPKEHLLDPADPIFDPTAYATRGKVMDGWETRRHAPTGRDWAIIRLGAPGVIRQTLIDTTHFRGNAPQRCALYGTVADALASSGALASADWTALLPPTPVDSNERNWLAVDHPRRVTHVRLEILPDGGVARLRLFGDVVADLRVEADRHDSLDLASALHGGQVVAVSEDFFGPGHNLIMVGDARDMSDGWETRRRRDDGSDWAIVRLGTTGLIDRVEVHTTHFLGNFPTFCAVEGCDAESRGVPPDDARWHHVVARTPLGPHARHVFNVDDPRPASHLRLRIFPDGGVARLRAYGRITDEGWRRAGVRWLDAASDADAQSMLRHCCASSRWVAGMLARRPFGSFAELAAAAGEEWSAIEVDDQLEAFAAHPRIGDRSGPRHTQREQSGTTVADAETLNALTQGNHEYEERFGHVFLINATGRSADDMLTSLRERLRNDPASEIEVAAEQQRQITRLRLDTMMRPTREPSA